MSPDRSRACVAAAHVLSFLPALQAPELPDEFSMSLVREYGRSVFQQCRLDLTVAPGGTYATVRCTAGGLDSAGQPPRPLVASRTLPASEATVLIDLARRSRLYDGGHVGVDGTPTDGVFELLRVTSTAGTALLVTSGNSRFHGGDPTRTTLLLFLVCLESELKRDAGLSLPTPSCIRVP
jgi:hypothetical protein